MEDTASFFRVEKAHQLYRNRSNIYIKRTAKQTQSMPVRRLGTGHDSGKTKRNYQFHWLA